MADGKKFRIDIISDLKRFGELIDQRFQGKVITVDADRKTNGRILHDVDLNAVTDKNVKDSIDDKGCTETVLNNKRKITGRNGDQYLVFFPDKYWESDGPVVYIFNHGAWC